MGLFDKPQFADGSLKELQDVAFVLVGASTRDVNTKFGERTALDLKVEILGEVYTYSGFSAGILQQINNSDESDYPTRCTIETVPLKNGNHTTQLVPLADEDDALPNVEPPATIANSAPEAEDDIPF